MKPPWLAEAEILIGEKEVPGAADNPAIMQLYADAGHPGTKHDEVAWCSAFVCACLERAGIESPKTLWALDFAKYGGKLPRPAYGCIGIKRRYKGSLLVGGHVFFVVGWDASHVYALGGNQSDAVSVVKIPRRTVFGYRWPLYTSPAEFPEELAYNGEAGTAGKES